MTELLEKIYTLVNTSLYNHCPVLSGNMRSGIKITKVEDKEVNIVVDAPYYNVDTFKETSWIWVKGRDGVYRKKQVRDSEGRTKGMIIYTGETVDTGEDIMTDYAKDVNLYGGFYTFNKSRFWANRAIVDAVKTIASEYNAVVVNKLPL